MKKILLVILVLTNLCGYTQKWERVFTGFPNAETYGMKESYDKGYLIAGNSLDVNGMQNYGYLIKTDVNGYKLWSKLIGDAHYRTSVFGGDVTPDGGLIVCGHTKFIDPSEPDPYIMKLNACGEKEWCRVYHTPGWLDYSKKVISLNDGYMMLVSYYGYDLFNKRLCLFRYDSQGVLLWQNYIAQADTLVVNEEANEMRIVDDSSFLITGYAYYPYPDTLWPRWMRPYIIKVGFDGTEYWDSPLGIPDSVTGQSVSTTVNKKGMIFTTGQNYNGGESFIITAQPSGDYLKYNTLQNNCVGSKGRTIDFSEDSSFLLMMTATGYDDTSRAYLLKVDTNYQIQKRVELFKTHWWGANGPMNTVITYDKKILLSGMFMKYPETTIKIYLWKFNQQMEFDSVYTRPFTYDSLCPHVIASDTINLDCDIVVDVDEPLKHPERSQLKAYPNPATGQITVELPKYLMSEESHGSLTSGHIMYQWRQGAVLEAYDSNGVRVLQKDIPAESSTMTLDVSQWAGGMYFIRLVRNGKMVGNVKVVVSQ